MMLMMRACPVWLVVALLSASAAGAGAPDPAFKPAEEQGFYTFDTGVVRGRVRLGGTSQGMTEVVHVASGEAVAVGGRLPGLFSYYRVFSTGTRYGKAARDWPTVTKVLPDGTLEVFWPAGEEHPLEMTARYRWSRPDALDVETVVKPLQDMPDFEVFVSSYYEKPFRAWVYVKPAGDAAGSPRFVPADRKPDSPGRYVMFPRDERALGLIQDGRWKIPPNPVDWDVVRWLAAPLAMRRDETGGLVALMMAPPEDCFAFSSPYNPETPDAGGYRSLYFSLFGRDLKAGEVARASCRLVVARNLSNEQAVAQYEQYLKEQREAAGPPPDRPAQAVELGEEDDGKTLSVPPGSSIVVRLEGNPTTGYSWQVTKIDGDALEQVGKIDYQERPHRPGMVGVGGTFAAKFKAARPGRSTVSLAYARPWEKDTPPAKSFRVTVQVQAK